MIPRCYVLLDDPSVLALRLTEIAKIVADTLGRAYPDVLPRVRYGRGILVRDANPAEARLLGRALARAGLGVFSIPEANLERAPGRPKRISKVEFREGGFALTLRGLDHIPPIELEWSEVWAIAPHGLLLGSASEERGALPTRGQTMAALSARATQLLSDLRHRQEVDRRRVRLCLDILADGSNLYRIHHDDTGVYQALENRSEHAVENFLELCDAFVRRAPEGVLIPDSVHRFIHTGAVESILYAKREALESALLWLAQAYAYGVAIGEDVDDLDDEDLTEEDEAILVDGFDDDAEDLDDADEFDSRDELEGDEDDEFGEGDVLSDDPEDGAAVGSPVADGVLALEESNDALEDSADELEEEGEDAGEDDPAGAELDPADLDDSDLDDSDLDDSDLPAADGEVAAALEHFEQTSRLDQAAIEAMLSQSRDLEELDDDVEVDGEIAESLDLFDASGRIDVREVLQADEEHSGE